MTLTLEEIMELRIKHSITSTYGDDDTEIRHVTEFVNAIIAAHNEKLREQEQEQKPVGFAWPRELEVIDAMNATLFAESCTGTVPLYVAPVSPIPPTPSQQETLDAVQQMRACVLSRTEGT